MAVFTRIEINPAIMAGKPVIKGTRITVALILRKIAEGASTAQILEMYPHLSDEDVRQAALYGAETVDHEEVLLVEDAQA